MKNLGFLLLVLCLVLFSVPSWASIYKYEDETGVVYFTNCPRDPQFKVYIQDGREDLGVPGSSPASTRVETNIKDTNVYDSVISEFAKKYEVDFALIKAIIRAESGFNPIAVSRKGARGLMQLMPETASRVNVSDPFNPRQNIEGGVRYFKYLLSLFNDDLTLSLAAYNAGENLVSQLGSIPPYRETIEYVQRVLNFYRSYNKP